MVAAIFALTVFSLDKTPALVAAAEQSQGLAGWDVSSPKLIGSIVANLQEELMPKSNKKIKETKNTS